MSAPSYTPRPWAVCDSNLVRITGGHNGRTTIAGVHRIGRLTSGERVSEVRANAHLLSAAPDLFEALQGEDQLIEELTVYVHSYLMRQRTAASLADKLVSMLGAAPVAQVAVARAAIAKALGQSEGEGEASS